MQPKVIYKDRHLLVLDKPAKMPTVDVPGGNPETLQQWLTQEFPKQSKVSKNAGLINRLDNETSGIVIAARKEDSYKKLRELWLKKVVIKEYTALVIGQAPIQGRITNLVAHHPNNPKKMIVVANADDAKTYKARYAETIFQLELDLFDYSMLKIRIFTGIRHQIRCHLAFIGFPIAGDKIYRKAKHKSRDWLDLQRHFLHAKKLTIPHPSSNKTVSFETDLPKDLKEALSKLQV